MYLLSRCRVWWDLITCPLPENAAGDILSSIQSTVVAQSPADCVVVTAFADDFPALLEKLYPRITLMMSHPEVNAQLLIRSLKPWGNDDDPDGENVLVISSDKEVLSYLKRLHRNNFNILVALPNDDSHSADLVPFASAVWHLSSLLDGKPPFLVRQNMVPSRAAKDKIGKHFTNHGGKKLSGNAKSCHKETRVVSKPSGKNARESQLGGISQGIKVVPRKIVSANTTIPGSTPVDLMGCLRDQIKGRCSLTVKKPALEEVSRGTKENIESHKSLKEGSKAGSNNIPEGRIGTARDQKNMGRCRIASPSDQNMGRCSPIVGKPAVKEVSHLGDSGKGSIEFHKSTKEISQGSTVVASKTGNANARTPGARLVNPNGGPRAAKDKIGKHFTNHGGKKLFGNAKSCHKETRVVSKPSGKNARESQLGEISQGIKVVPRKIVSANTNTPGSRPIDLMGSPRDQIKGRCSLRVKKPALEEVSLPGEGRNGSVESHKSSKELRNAGIIMALAPIQEIQEAESVVLEIKRIWEDAELLFLGINMGRCSPIVGKPDVKEVSHLFDSGKGSIEFHKSTKEISQGSKLVPSKTVNANTRTLGACTGSLH